MKIFEAFFNNNEYIELDEEMSNIIHLIGPSSFMKKFQIKKEKCIFVFEKEIFGDICTEGFNLIDLSTWGNYDLQEHVNQDEASIDNLNYKILSILPKKYKNKCKNSVLASLKIFQKKTDSVNIPSLIDFLEKDSTIMAHKDKIIKPIIKFLKKSRPQILPNKIMFYNFGKSTNFMKSYVLDILLNELSTIYIQNNLGVNDESKELNLSSKLRDLFILKNNSSSGQLVIHWTLDGKDFQKNETNKKYLKYGKAISDNFQKHLIYFGKENENTFKLKIPECFIRNKNHRSHLMDINDLFYTFYSKKEWDNFLHLYLCQKGFENIKNLNETSLLLDSKNTLDYSIYSADINGEKTLFYLTDIIEEEQDKELILKYKNKFNITKTFIISKEKGILSTNTISQLYSDIITSNPWEGQPEILNIYSFITEIEKEKDVSPLFFSSKNMISYKKL